VEALAFVEILGRHNDVLARHPVYRWPALAGRAYDAGIILDDPFVAPRHVSIEPAADGRYRVSDLQTVNGLSLPPSAQRLTEADVGPDDVVRLGRTQIRIRPPSYAVRPEQQLRATAFYRRPAAFGAAAAVFAGLTLWGAWVGTTSRDEWASLIFPTMLTCVAVAVWISVWSLVSRTVGGRANFAAHGFVACAALAAIALTGTLFDYLSFGFDAHWLDRAGTGAGAALAAFMLYRHLRLNSRAPRRRLAVIAVLVVAAGFGVAAGIERAGETRREGQQRYDNALKPPAFLWASGVAPEVFLAEGAKLRRRADAAARAAN
jgi:FHA domain